jgi:aspartate carbamoyltransferase catalytic subunit
MSWDKKNLISIDPFTTEDMDEVFELTDYFVKVLEEGKILDACKGKVMKLWFGEPSTRTYGSFEIAMARLGGLPLRFEEKESSLKKLESITHTVRILSDQCDILVDRHKDPQHIHRIVQYSAVPTINGGNGDYEHPTQTLLDLYTIKKENGRIDGNVYALAGDLKYGRTTHSLNRGLEKYHNIEVNGISPPGLEMPEKHVNTSYYHSHAINMKKDLKEKLREIKPEFLYVTRVQFERIGLLERVFFGSRYRYQINQDILDGLSTKVMHPLPIATGMKHGPEIATDFDYDPRAIYFKQAKNGIPVRMAIIVYLLGLQNKV